MYTLCVPIMLGIDIAAGKHNIIRFEKRTRDRYHCVLL